MTVISVRAIGALNVLRWPAFFAAKARWHAISGLSRGREPHGTGGCRISSFESCNHSSVKPESTWCHSVSKVTKPETGLRSCGVLAPRRARTTRGACPSYGSHSFLGSPAVWCRFSFCWSRCPCCPGPRRNRENLRFRQCARRRRGSRS